MRSMSVALILFLSASAAMAGWEEDLDRLLTMAPGEERDALVAEVAKAAPGVEEIAGRITGRDRPEASTGAILRKRTCKDGVERPWVLVVPEGYDPARPTPLLVALHGLISRPEVISDPLEHAERAIYTEMARDRGWLVAYPMGQKDATWFDDVGMENIEAIVRAVKRERNVDDDRVYLAGFSDGGSAAFSYAMLRPNDYGAFLALNGHMGVASQYGKLETYAPNLSNTPVYVMTSDRDPLYPTEKMRPAIEMAMAAGARFLYRQFPGGHDWRHVRPELKHIADYLERHPRDPFPGRVVWETADPERFGACRWLEVTGVSGGPRAPWHEDHNALLADDRVTIGFMHTEYEGDGVKVGSVMDDTFAAEVGLQKDDIVVGMNGDPVTSLEDLSAAKAKVERGDEVALTVLRGEKKVTLKGNLPPVEHYWIFNHRLRSALLEATCSANHVIVDTSRVESFRILLHPAMVDLDQPLRVVVDGEVVFEDLVEPDPAFLLGNYLENRDRRLLYTAALEINVPK